MTRQAMPFGAFEIASLPSQCQIGVCHGFFVEETNRGNGFGKILKEEQNRALSALKYDLGICTVSENNGAQKSILSKMGWRRIDSFYNTRLGETTEIWSYHVLPK